MKEKPAKKPRFIKPPNVLKQKIGSGGIDEALLDKGQHYIENTELDFVPYARQYLEDLSKQVQHARHSLDNFKTSRDNIVAPVMQLKANGGMFQYHLVSDVANIALQFLEAIEEFNEDAFDVVKAHQNTINVIINNKLKGSGGSEGHALVKELDKACKRYFAKHQPE